MLRYELPIWDVNRRGLDARKQWRRRSDLVRKSLRACDVCEVRCGTNRLAGQVGPCGLTAQSYIYDRRLSLAEEVELLPAYLVYLSACNLRCQFCLQGPGCFNPRGGTVVNPRELARELERAVEDGARTVTFIGGEPGLHPHTILAVAAEFTRPMPLVLKTNLYLTPQTLDVLRGAVKLFVVDFKFGNDGCAFDLAGCPRYLEVLQRNLLQLHCDGQQMLIRHLLMPGHVECCLRPAAEWVAAHLGGAVFRVMSGYVPAWRTERDPVLGRCCDRHELAAAEALVCELGLRDRGGFDLA